MEGEGAMEGKEEVEEEEEVGGRGERIFISFTWWQSTEVEARDE